jgi:chromosome segregation ATPase
MSHNEETEAKAYINWLNIKLKGLGIKVSSLETDFKTGVNTNHLAQVLLKKEYRFLERPRSEFQFIQNNNQALGELRKDGCILHGSDGISMTNGNKPITRGFIWQLMLHYQINRDFPGKSIADARRDALKFINDALATLTEDETTQIRMLCGDFDKIDTPITCQSFDAISFHDGCVLAGLAVAINHSTRQETLAEIQKRCNDEKISPTQTPSEDPLVALTYASMCTAEERNEIPVLIDASDIVNAFEANSVLVYVSYYQHAKRDTAAAALASKLPPGMVPKDADFPLFDELEFLSKENNDKETHRDESHITSASQVSIDMPTMQQLQRDYDYLDQILRSFDSYCEKHGHFEENSHNSLLFSRIKAHHIRLSLDINNYQFSIQEIIKLHEEKIRLEVEMEEEKNRSAKEIETLRGEVTALQHKQHDNDIIIKGLRDNIESLSNQLKNNDNEHEKLLSEIEILKKNEQNNQEILSKLNSEVDLLKSTSVDLTNQLAHTTNAILANEAEKEVLNTQLSDNEAQKAILVENNEKLTKNLEHYQLIESNLDLELSKLRQEYDSLNGEHGGLKERLVDYNALVLKVHETDKLIAALQNELQEVKNHCERDHIVEIGSLKASIALLESKNKELSEDNKEKEDELGAKMIEIKNIKLGIAGKDEEIKKYQNEIEESKQQIEKTNKLNDGKKNDQILELRAEIQFKQGQNDKYVNQLDELMNKLKALEDDLKNEMELKELLIQQKNQIESKNSEQNLGLQESIKNLKKENDELNSQISLKDELISKLQLQIDDLGSQIAELGEELASLEQKYDELFAEKKELENKYNFLFEEALILKNDSENYEKLKNDYENSQKALSDFEAKYTLLDNLHNETLQSKQRDDRDSNSELIALKHAMGLLQTELAQKNDEIIQNGQKIKQLEDKIDEQNTQIGTKNEKIDELQRRIANNDAQITDLMQKLTGYDQNLKNLSDFEKQIENLREEIENQENKISKLEISLAAANATSTSIDSQITERDGVIADLKKKLHDVEKMKKDGDEKGEEVGERIKV